MAELVFKEESYAIVGAAMSVHSALGPGFVEKVYQEALAIEFEKRGIPFEREKRFQVIYDGNTLSRDFYVDFVCYGRIVVELKATASLAPVFVQQVASYLRAGNFELGYLLNFGESQLVYKRILNTYHH